jgi:hypothetical protein
MSAFEGDRRSSLLRAAGSAGLAGVIGYVILAAKLGVAFAVPIGIIGVVAVTIALRGPLGQALLGRYSAAPSDDSAHLLAEVDELRGRVQELEERADFADRLLTQQARRPGTPAGD